MKNFGMPTLIENSTLEQNISLCKELGLSFIELNMNFPEYQIDKLEAVEWLYKKADEAGVYYTIHLDENLNVADFNPLVREAYLETVRRTIEVAKQLVELKNKYGNKAQPVTINMHMHHGIYITLPDRKVQMYERDFETYIAAFQYFIKSCEEDSCVKFLTRCKDTKKYQNPNKKIEKILYIIRCTHTIRVHEPL